MANCLTCIHQEVCKERMEIFNLPNIACQYEAHELVGEWMREGQRYRYLFRCTNCNTVCGREYYFCPNCGAKMKEGEVE